MNKTYRIIYNHHTGTYVAVAENTHARGKASRAGKVLNTVAVGAVLALSSMNAAAVETYGNGGGNSNATGMAIGGDGVCAPSTQAGQVVYDAQGNPFSSTGNNQLAWVEGNGGLAIGTGCYAQTVALQNAVAAGNGASAGENAVAIGTLALAEKNSSVAIGNGSQAFNTNSVAIGVAAKATEMNAIAIGAGAKANGIALGNQAIAFHDRDISIGDNAGNVKNSNGDNVIIGYGAGNGADGFLHPSGYHPGLSNTVMIGSHSGSGAQGNQNVMVGGHSGASSIGNENSYIGIYTGGGSTGSYNVANGFEAGRNQIGSHNVAMGKYAAYQQQGSFNSALGGHASRLAEGNGNSSTGFAASTLLVGDNNVAMGASAGSELWAKENKNGQLDYFNRANKAVGIWDPNEANAYKNQVSNTVSIGNWAISRSDNGVAVGNNAVVDKNVAGSLALGSQSYVNVANSVALGLGSVANVAATAVTGANIGGTAPVGVVSVGKVGAERQIQNVAAGQVTAFSTDAINGSQLYAVLQNTGGTGGGTPLHFITSTAPTALKAIMAMMVPWAPIPSP